MMRLTTTALGLITLGILLLGAQLVLYLGYKNIHPASGQEHHIQPARRVTFLPGVFGIALVVAGVALRPHNPRAADDPQDGRTIPH